MYTIDLCGRLARIVMIANVNFVNIKKNVMVIKKMMTMKISRRAGD